MAIGPIKGGLVTEKDGLMSATNELERLPQVYPQRDLGSF